MLDQDPIQLQNFISQNEFDIRNQVKELNEFIVNLWNSSDFTVFYIIQDNVVKECSCMLIKLIKHYKKDEMNYKLMTLLIKEKEFKRAKERVGDCVANDLRMYRHAQIV